MHELNCIELSLYLKMLQLKIKNLFSLNLYEDKAKLFWFERLDKTK